MPVEDRRIHIGKVGAAVGIALFAGLLTFRGCVGAGDSPDSIPVYRSSNEAADGMAEAAKLSVGPIERFFAGEKLTEKQTNDLVEADRLITGVIAFDPSQFQVYVAVGRIQFALGDYELAEVALREAVHFAPSEPSSDAKMVVAETHYLLSRTLFAKRLYAPAIEEAEIALKLAPENPDNLTARAAALIQVGKSEEAAKDLAHALEHYPDHARANQLRKLLAGSGG